MSLSLPPRPNLDQLRKQAKDLLTAWRSGDAGALALLHEHHPGFSQAGAPPVDRLRLSDAQWVLARQYGFPSWSRLKEEVELANLDFQQRADRFVRAAASENSGTDADFRYAKRLLARDPALTQAGVYTALVLGDVEAVRRQAERDPEWVRRKGGPLDREPLHYVSYSKFHREEPRIAEGLLAIARLLLDHPDQGADPDAPFTVEGWDSPLRPLCGACGIANFPEMAELLLDRGATIDDFESLYHSLEHPDSRCLDLLLARGASPKGTNALNHAFDYPGLERIRKLLDHGADPNEVYGPGGPCLLQALQRGRERAVLELLVAHGADIHARRSDGKTPVQVAMQHGDHEAAAYLAGLGADTTATPFERFAEACGRGDLETARRIVADEPRLLETLSFHDREAFAHLAQRGKTEMITALLDAGLPVQTAGWRGQTALHWASWWGRRDVVAVLLARGAALEAVESEFGATPLGWAAHGSENAPNPDGDYPGVVRLLLDAGADATKVETEGSNEAVAELLRAAGARVGEEE
jgi:ankyrin repeat protein